VQAAGTSDGENLQVAGAKNPYVLQGKLPTSLIMTPEITGDYIQFVYGALSWRSDTVGSDIGDEPGCETTKWVTDTQSPGHPVSSVLQNLWKGRN
jgi:hypothetical protein